MIVGGVAAVAVLIVGVVVATQFSSGLASLTDSHRAVMNDMADISINDMPDYFTARMKGETPPTSPEAIGNKLESLGKRWINLGPITIAEKEALEKEIEEKWKEQKEETEERMKAAMKGENGNPRPDIKALSEAGEALGYGMKLFSTAHRALLIPEEPRDDHDRKITEAISLMHTLFPDIVAVGSASAGNSLMPEIKEHITKFEAILAEREALGEDSKTGKDASTTRYMSLYLANSSLLIGMRKHFEDEYPDAEEFHDTLRDLSSAFRKACSPIRPGRPTTIGSTPTSRPGGSSSSGDKRVTNNAKQIMLAMHNHHDTKRQFPSAGNGPNNSQGLSWRVHLLPYLEHRQLYDQFNLDEPWDSATNKPLIAKMPDVFKGAATVGAGQTTFHVFIGEGSFFSKEKPSMRNCLDGTSNTLGVIDAGASKAEPWTKPGGLTLSGSSLSASSGNPPAGTYTVVTVDGRVYQLSPNAPMDLMKLLVNPADKQKIEDREKYLF